MTVAESPAGCHDTPDPPVIPRRGVPLTPGARMRFSPLLPALLLALAPAARADDTQAFLDPANWEGRTDIWKVESGSIVGETMEDPKYNTFLCSKKKYGDFELSFKVQLRDGVGNSGVQVRSTMADPKKFVVRGPQVDVGKGYWGSL